MAPGTNTGAAHPVIMGAEMDPVMKEKLENDAAASLRSIAGRRGRNVPLAESAVRQSKSFTEQEALAGHLIEIVATDEYDLLRQLDGREITRFNGSKVTLHVAGAEMDPYHLSWRQQVMVALSDPNMALIVLALGVLGIYLEFSMPGLIFPGVAGAILALLGLAALSVLPLNWLGVSLVILALAMFVLEMKFASHGILSAGGAVALVLGATMLVEGPIPEMRIHLATALAVAAPLAIITSVLVTLVVRARQSKVVTGAEGMVGQVGTALDELNPEGRILVHGENWLAQSRSNVPRGATVRVMAIRNLRLRVEPVAATDEKENEK
jgi:membrane-bound serine protease (ClpP class)